LRAPLVVGPPVELDHAIDELTRRGEVVIDQHDRLAALARLTDEAPHEPCAVRIEIRRRLVEEEDLGTEGEDAGECEALLLAARERAGRMVVRIRESDARERSVDTRPDLGGRYATVLEPERHVVAGPGHDELRLRILEDHARSAFDAEVAFGLATTGPVQQARDAEQQGALP